jgi:hypothetical protein
MKSTTAWLPNRSDTIAAMKAVALLAFASVVLAQAPTAGPHLSDDEIAIYRTYLETVAKKATVHLGNRTAAITGSLDQPCLTNFGITIPEAANHAGSGFDSALIKGLKVQLVDADAQKGIVAATKDAKEASSTALYTLSPVAFDKDHQHAAMQYAIFCGDRCSNRALLIFEKVKGQWRWTGRFCGRVTL